MGSIGPTGPSGIPQNYPNKNLNSNQQVIDDLNNCIGTVSDLIGEVNLNSNLKDVLSELKSLSDKIQELSQTPGLPQNVVDQLHSASVNLQGAQYQINGWIQKGDTTPTQTQVLSIYKAGTAAVTSMQTALYLLKQ